MVSCVCVRECFGDGREESDLGWREIMEGTKSGVVSVILWRDEEELAGNGMDEIACL